MNWATLKEAGNMLRLQEGIKKTTYWSHFYTWYLTTKALKTQRNQGGTMWDKQHMAKKEARAVISACPSRIRLGWLEIRLDQSLGTRSTLSDGQTDRATDSWTDRTHRKKDCAFTWGCLKTTNSCMESDKILILECHLCPCRGHISSSECKHCVAMATGGCSHHMFHFSGDTQPGPG